MKSRIFIVFILTILLFQCKPNMSGGVRTIASPQIDQMVYPNDYEEAASVIDMILVREGFSALSDNLYTRQSADEETGLSVQFEKGFSKTLFFYTGAIDNLEYIPMNKSEKAVCDSLIQKIREKLSVIEKSDDPQVARFSDRKPVKIHTFRLSDFSLKHFDEFSLFSCSIKNESRYQFLNLGITFQFQNAYGTVVETKQVVLNYLAPWQKKSIDLTLTVNQEITDFTIKTSVN